jgi:hypothetical protein
MKYHFQLIIAILTSVIFMGSGCIERDNNEEDVEEVIEGPKLINMKMAPINGTIDGEVLLEEDIRSISNSDNLTYLMSLTSGWIHNNLTLWNFRSSEEIIGNYTIINATLKIKSRPGQGHIIIRYGNEEEKVPFESDKPNEVEIFNNRSYPKDHLDSLTVSIRLLGSSIRAYNPVVEIDHIYLDIDFRK